MSKRGNVLALIGGQYGSEGKGVIVAHLAGRYQIHVRVGAPNAGHSFKHLGKVWKMQSIPVGWKDPNALLVIGAGALINPDILIDELEAVKRVDPTVEQRLRIDAMAGILDPAFYTAEGGTQGEIHKRIGSTGEGVGAARVARIMRNPDAFYHFKDLVKQPLYANLSRMMDDTVTLINTHNQRGANVLLEGSQGVNLSLVHGPWPYVTSNDCGAAQLAADIGISPRYINQIMVVARANPIRVAGNSGPLKNEITWEELSNRLGKPVLERTTVTRKIRRIGEWDEDLIAKAVLLNGPTSFAFTFADYLDSAVAGVDKYALLTDRVIRFLHYLERRFTVPVSMVGTGGSDWSVIETGASI